MKKTKNSIKFFALILICLSLTVSAFAQGELVPLGHTTGIKLLSDGAIIISLSEDIINNPCKGAGLAPGDVIKRINGAAIHSNEDLKNAISENESNVLEVEYSRNGKNEKAEITPVKNENGKYVIGALVRDSIAGIGTMTYFDPETKTYGALGHGISDSDTGLLIPIDRGSLMPSSVAGVRRGLSGSPGELIGEYKLTEDFADIKKNTPGGIFGSITSSDAYENLKSYPVAEKNEIKRGKATILSNIDGETVEEYEIEITGIYHDGESTKNMLIRATDARLLDKTGGIVRGMSGSPILQNGKLVGAVTHVLVNDPTKGYGIFIENMLDMAA